MKGPLLRVNLFLSLILCALASAHVFAQDFPNRPVRFVVGYAPGGAVDIMARAVAQKLGETWKQSVVVDNRPGASEFIAAEHVAKSAPDGYTLFVATEIGLEVNPLLYSKLPYDPKRDFVPVTRLLEGPMMFAVSPGVPATNMKEFIAHAKSQPGKVNYGSSGLGGQVHLSMAYLAKATGIELVHVPYKGSAPAVQDMLGGVVHSTAAPASLLGPHVLAGKLRAIGVAGDKRVKFLPDVPTLREQGYADLDASWALAIVAPTGTPLALRSKIAADVRHVIKEPKFEDEQFDKFGYIAVGDTPEQFADFLVKNLPKQTARVQAANVKLD
ncbi:MAG: Bug family tripartite tricarboxylate transporter substrate binding protein [Burkholderiales bacterium]